jgi:hypothetical protein
MSNRNPPPARLPHYLPAGYVVLFTVLAFNPVARDVWWTGDPQHHDGSGSHKTMNNAIV